MAVLNPLDDRSGAFFRQIWEQFSPVFCALCGSEVEWELSRNYDTQSTTLSLRCRGRHKFSCRIPDSDFLSLGVGSPVDLVNTTIQGMLRNDLGVWWMGLNEALTNPGSFYNTKRAQAIETARQQNPLYVSSGTVYVDVQVMGQPPEKIAYPGSLEVARRKPREKKLKPLSEIPDEPVAKPKRKITL